MMSEISEAAANSINTWSTMVSIVAAAITALTVCAAIWSNGIIKLYSAERIRTAEAVAAIAREGVANARIDIARAKKSAAASRAEAAKAQLAATQISARLTTTQSKLEAANAIKPLSDEQLHRLRHSLAGYAPPAGAVISTAAPNDREAEYIAAQVDHVLTSAGIPRTFGEGADSYRPTGREKGRVVVAYGSAVPRETAEDLARRLSHGGLPASVAPLKPEIDPEIEKVAQDFIILRLVPAPRTSY